MTIYESSESHPPNRATDDDGTEVESLDDDALKIECPFNPEKIKVRTVNIIVEQLISRIRHKEIDLTPEFQRMRGIWKESFD